MGIPASSSIDDTASGSPATAMADGGATHACTDGGGTLVRRPAASARDTGSTGGIPTKFSGDYATGTPATT
jgi:hypothetical protein